MKTLLTIIATLSIATIIIFVFGDSSYGWLSSVFLMFFIFITPYFYTPWNRPVSPIGQQVQTHETHHHHHYSFHSYTEGTETTSFDSNGNGKTVRDLKRWN